MFTADWGRFSERRGVFLSPHISPAINGPQGNSLIQNSFIEGNTNSRQVSRIWGKLSWLYATMDGFYLIKLVLFGKILTILIVYHKLSYYHNGVD